MYRILVNLHGRAQMKRVSQQKLADLEDIMHETALRYGALAEEKAAYPYIFSLPSGYQESSYIALETGLALQAVLAKKRAKHYGSIIIIGKESPAGENDLAKYVYLADKDDQLWIAASLKEEFASWLNFESSGELLIAKERKVKQSAMQEAKKRFLLQKQTQDFLQQNYIACQKSGEAAAVRLYGALGVGKRTNVQEFLSKKPMPEGMEPLWISPDSGRYGETEPFRRGLCPAILKHMEEFASDEEKNDLTRLKGIIHAVSAVRKASVSPDSLSKDYSLLYKMYIKTYKRLALQFSFPLVAVIEEPEAFSVYSQALLDDFLMYCTAQKLFVVTVSRNKPNRIISKNDKFLHMQPAKSYDLAADGQESFAGKRLERANPYALALYNWQSKDGKKDYYGDFSLNVTLRWLVKKLDPFSKRALFAAALCEGMAPYNVFLSLLASNSKERLIALQRLQTFYELQLIRGQAYPRLAFPELEEILRASLGKDAEALQKEIALCLYKASSDGFFINLFFLFSLLEKAGCVQEGLDTLHRMVWQALNNRQEGLGGWLKKGCFNAAALKPEDKERLKTIVYTGKLRKKMLEAGSIHELEVFLEAEDFPSFNKGSDVYLDHCRLQRLRCLTASGDPEGAFNSIKEALFAFQKNSSHYGEALANAEMAYALLLQGRFRQAFDYCEIANRISEQLDCRYSALVSLTVEAAAYFSYGNLSAAYKITCSAAVLAAEAACREKELFFRFTQARIEFELGRYEAAAVTLEAALALAVAYQKNSMLPVMTAWRGRSLAYLGQHEAASHAFGLYSHRESLFFLAESRYLQNDLAGALESCNKALALPEEPFYQPSEKENWQNGYALLEGRLQPSFLGKELLKYLITTFAVFLKGLAGSQRDALSELAQLYDFHKINADEPYGYIFPYYYALLLDPETEKEERFMAESRASRLLSIRASRFDDLKMKEELLKKNYWNKQISAIFSR